jgi:Rha family phage regulatory protein
MTVATIETNTKAATLERKHAKSIKKPKAQFSLIIHGSNNQIAIDSRVIAKQFGRRHDNVLQTVRRLIKNQTISALDCKEREYLVRGKKQPCFELNERGFLIAMPFIGGHNSEQGQVVLVDAFLNFKRQLEKQSKLRETEGYQLARISGKDTRAILAEVIQQFIDFATQQGSQSASNYYRIITKAVQDALFEVQQDISDVRQLLNPVQLQTLALAETIAAQVISDGMTKQLPYKAIYQAVKTALQPLSANKTNVLGVNDGE